MPTVETWVERLKAAYEAGYYRTERAESEQTAFPWQNKTCKDCPFWLNGVCRVHAVQRSADDDTCAFFDPQNHRAAQSIIDGRMQTVRRMWWGRLGT
ncbi:MAG TPA: hypothetical protein VKX16_11585 [Chloroflexota bacterium]|nr:hypothetical protein [Chloroflexota bacterium]